MGFLHLKICIWFSFLHHKKDIVGEEKLTRRTACVIREIGRSLKYASISQSEKVK